MLPRHILYSPTRLGLWSAGLFGGAIVLFGLFGLGITMGVRGGDTYWSQPLLSIPFTLAGVSGVASGVSAIVDGVRERRVTVLGVLAVLVAATAIIFVGGEIITPH